MTRVDESFDFFVVWKPAVQAIADGAIAANEPAVIGRSQQYPDGSIQIARDDYLHFENAWKAANRLGFDFYQNTGWRALSPWGPMGFRILIPEAHLARLGGERSVGIYPARFAPVSAKEYSLDEIQVNIRFRRRRSRDKWVGADTVHEVARKINRFYAAEGSQIRIASDIAEASKTLSFTMDLSHGSQLALNAFYLFAIDLGTEDSPVTDVDVAR